MINVMWVWRWCSNKIGFSRQLHLIMKAASIAVSELRAKFDGPI